MTDDERLQQHAMHISLKKEVIMGKHIKKMMSISMLFLNKRSGLNSYLYTGNKCLEQYILHVITHKS